MIWIRPIQHTDPNPWTNKTKQWSLQEIQAVNWLLKNKQLVRDAIKGPLPNRQHTDHKFLIKVPDGLDMIDAYPLWMCRVDNYLLMCAQRAQSATIGYWLCQYSGPLTAHNRRLMILITVGEWLDWDFPKPTAPGRNLKKPSQHLQEVTNE